MEMKEILSDIQRSIDDLQQKLKDVPAEYMPHDELKALSAKAKFAIRTGEFSPYPNVILRAGVVF